MTGKKPDENALIDRFSRRHLLAASAAMTAGLAGCLGGSDDSETANSETDDGDDDGDGPDPVEQDEVPGPGAAVVEDPPDAVYLPTHREAFEFLPMEQAGDYVLMPHFTYAHTFWLMRGDQREEVPPAPQTLHLMFAFWDAETGEMLPVDVAGTMEVWKDGERVDGPRNPWPMISQGMGFHFGDNVPFASADHDASFPEEGTYEIELQLDPIGARKTGDFAGRFEEPVSTTFEFEFSIEDFEAITEGIEFFDEERWGERGAISLMGHGGGHDDTHEDGHGDEDGHDSHDGYDHPNMALPSADTYPGHHIGSYESHDADFVVQYLEDSRLAEDGENYLFVSPRTPYNRVPLPDMALSVEGDIDGVLAQTLDSELGHHYGMTVDLTDGEEFDLIVESPPQVARHQGYETAFIDMPAMSVEVSLDD